MLPNLPTAVNHGTRKLAWEMRGFSVLFIFASDRHCARFVAVGGRVSASVPVTGTVTRYNTLALVRRVLCSQTA